MHQNRWFWTVESNERWKIAEDSLRQSQLCSPLDRWREEIWRHLSWYMELWCYPLCFANRITSFRWGNSHTIIPQNITYYFNDLEGNYTIPYNVNPLASDLIRRMLQVDPYKRIRIHEIKNHPWVRSTVQLYAKVPRCYSFEKEENSEIDD